MGADGIGTTCGFLSLFQDDIAKAAGVPVASSSLMQVPWVDSTLPPDKRAGIITISKESVTSAHLEAVGVALDTPIVGTESGKTFTTTVLDDGDYMDFELARD
ncbi:MAG: aspartate/glutamate racemase family protein, partial [Pseudomonadota bacterium]|nr:aspartate/glutamate racemase family protein [Pseudomonadota bacterium]